VRAIAGKALQGGVSEPILKSIMTDFQIYRPSLDEILDGTPLTPAEERLLAACKIHGTVSFAGEVSEEATPENSIRGGLIRYLMMGGCDEHQPNAKGVGVRGAVITGLLDLRGCRSPLNLHLAACRFTLAPLLVDAEIGGLLLSGSHMPGLDAQRLLLKRSVFLREGFHATGHVDFLGATIGGQFICNKGEFHADLILRGVDVGADLVLKDVKCISGDLELRNANVGSLVDDLESWLLPKRLYLEGFHYGKLRSDMSVSDRIKVLENHASGFIDTTFHSQPDTHLANYYQKSGQRQAAARVLFDREKRLARAELAQSYAATDGTWKMEWPRFGADFALVFKWIFQILAGYGHKPMRAFYWALGTILFSIIYFHLAYINGQMVPNSDIILTSADCLACVAANPTFPVEAWSETIPGKDYETFSAIGYGFDLFIPLDALGQELAWAPSYARGWYGTFGHYLRWPIQVMGWMLTGIGAALLTGLIGRERE